jgi:hypothetical protein
MKPRRILWVLATVVGVVLGVGWLRFQFSGEQDIATFSSEPVESSALNEPLTASATQTTALSMPAMPAMPGRAKRWFEKQTAELDPRADGWDSEAFSELAVGVLDQLAKILTDVKPPTSDQLRQLVADRFSCTSLQSESPERLFTDETLRVDRATIELDPNDNEAAVWHEVDGLAAALHQLMTPFANGRNRRVKFKLFEVETTGGSIVTRQFVSIAADTEYGNIEQNATWRICWAAPTATDRPRMTWVGVERWEQVTNTSGGAVFQDCTQDVLGNMTAYREQLANGIDYWLQRRDASLIDPFGHHGLAVGDANGDGRDDIYVCQPGGLPNLLFLQLANGTVEDASARAAVDILDITRSALFVDLDNDDDQDLAVATISHLLLFENDGAGKFALRVRLADVQDAHSLTATDFDNDGLLDLYVCSYRGNASGSMGSPTPIPIHDATNGGRNLLFRNVIERRPEPEWKFVDVTSQVGLDEDNQRWSYAAAWEDYDNDGDQDLYVANDFGRNTLYRNDKGRFSMTAAEAGIREAAFGMSVTWGDYNQDGQPDAYVSNMFSGAGNRITNQPQFQPSASSEVRQALRFTARGNTLFENQGDGKFRDVSESAGVTMGRWAWSSLFCDINNDSRPDLLVGNGFLTREDTGDL